MDFLRTIIPVIPPDVSPLGIITATVEKDPAEQAKNSSAMSAA